MQGRVLIVAGSDSGGGAGVQADIKTVTALGGYATSAITALTAQNTLCVKQIVEVAPDFVQLQMQQVLDDIGAECIKTGMLPNSQTIEMITDYLEQRPDRPLIVVDPVMVAKGGQALVSKLATQTLMHRLMPIADLLTPNLPEAEMLLGRKIKSAQDMLAAAQALRQLGPKAVLLKGGHLEGDELWDVLVSASETQSWHSQRIETTHTHGTGCTLASAIATGLAQGLSLPQAIDRARRYLYQAILSAPKLGQGHGPIDHGHAITHFS